MRLVNALPDTALAVAQRLQAANYARELYARRHTADTGIDYRMYGFVAPRAELLRGFLLANADPGDVVIDAGANVGVYALPAAVAGCDVYAYEPDTTAVGRLRANVAVNDYPDGADVTVEWAGLSNDIGSRDFYQQSLSTLSTFEARDRNPERTADVVSTPVTTLDIEVKYGGVPAPDHVKIDVEGHEAAVLEGMTDVVADHRPTIYAEIHTDDREQRGYLREWFDGRDYDLARYDHRWLAVPSERASEWAGGADRRGR